MRQEVALADYTKEILASGLPGLRPLPDRVRRSQLNGYAAHVVDRDIPDDAGVVVRNPAALRRCDARNTASTAVAARLGMRLEATYVDGEWFKGEWTTPLVYALLRREWETRRG